MEEINIYRLRLQIEIVKGYVRGTKDSCVERIARENNISPDDTDKLLQHLISLYEGEKDQKIKKNNLMELF